MPTTVVPATVSRELFDAAGVYFSTPPGAGRYLSLVPWVRTMETTVLRQVTELDRFKGSTTAWHELARALRRARTLYEACEARRDDRKKSALDTMSRVMSLDSLLWQLAEHPNALVSVRQTIQTPVYGWD